MVCGHVCTLELHVHTHMDLHVECPLRLCDFIAKWNRSNFFAKFSSI